MMKSPKRSLKPLIKLAEKSNNDAPSGFGEEEAIGVDIPNSDSLTDKEKNKVLKNVMEEHISKLKRSSEISPRDRDNAPYPTPVIDSIGQEQFRVYPFENLHLPKLDDANNFYSGKYQDLFWHQNADQVLVFIPIDEEVGKKDVKFDVEVESIKLYVRGELKLEANLPERVIPSGSFWCFEQDVNQRRYISLDLEKRLRYINWRSLIDLPEYDTQRQKDQESKLEKLFEANQGLSKLTGNKRPPATIKEMMEDSEIMNAISGDMSDVNKVKMYHANGTQLTSEEVDQIDDPLSFINNNSNYTVVQDPTTNTLIIRDSENMAQLPLLSPETLGNSSTTVSPISI